MSQSLILPDDLFQRLAMTAKNRGYSIEQLLEKWQLEAEQLAKRRQVVQQIESLRQRLQATYGEMPDSAELIREDRGR